MCQLLEKAAHGPIRLRPPVTPAELECERAVEQHARNTDTFELQRESVLEEHGRISEMVRTASMGTVPAARRAATAKRPWPGRAVGRFHYRWWRRAALW